MKAVFADTFYWIALVNPVDRHAGAARAYDEVLASGAVYTTEEVLAEVLTFFAGDVWLRRRAAETVHEIISDPTVKVVAQSHESFLGGFTLYAARPDKAYSLADCISMEAMRREGIGDVLTNDRHFEQEGFRALFREA